MALRGCRAVIILITPDSTRSQYVAYEWSYALGLGKEIIPILYRSNEIHAKLLDYQYLDFRDIPKWDDLLKYLLDIKHKPAPMLGFRSLVSRFESLAARRETTDIEVDDLINLLMDEKIIDYGDVSRMQNILEAHRARRAP